ncbi:Fe(3+) ABC transporter substrate-binding protein [Breoghania sp.]|uniref:Fe(3+) ABC transporter substrate-binding protein n=1 Tax=Breoghania sp. TaxID=2065378 RepID=UPI002AAA79FC|nr:Fe(3+) ABC transporter substrate-binding protein [Breoghania sp.]
MLNFDRSGSLATAARRLFSTRALSASCLTLSLALVAGSLGTTTAKADGEVNIYSYRQPYLIQPMLDRFTQETGIKTNIVYASKGLGERIRAEGTNSPADIMLTVDIGRLERSKELDFAAPLDSGTIEANIPENFRDPDNRWFGLTGRARVVYASRERVSQDNITYAELADPKWKGRLCTRSGQHDYTIGLIASIIAHEGREKAKAWLSAVKENLARKPTGNDRAQVQAIYAGECDIALGNTYYMGKMLTNDKEPEQETWARSVKILFPNAEERGSHVNISGMVLTKHAPNRENAVKLMEFLTSDEAQGLYAEINFEYPLNPHVQPSELVSSWGKLHPDSLPLIEIARHRQEASELVDEVAFDDGPSS